MPGELGFGRPQHSRIVHNTAVHLTHATIRIEEDDKENQRERQGNLGPLIDPEQ